MLDIYSALRDPTTGDVRLFLEYYKKRMSLWTEEDSQKGWPAFSELFDGCVFSDSRNFSNSLHVTAKDVRLHYLHPSQ